MSLPKPITPCARGVVLTYIEQCQILAAEHEWKSQVGFWSWAPHLVWDRGYDKRLRLTDPKGRKFTMCSHLSWRGFIEMSSLDYRSQHNPIKFCVMHKSYRGES